MRHTAISADVSASVSNLVSYSDARRGDSDPDSFGKGNPKGVVASESANSSSEGGSMTTLLALGIPGGNATALLLSAFAMHNIIGGPRFIAEQRDLVYAIILGNMAQAALLIAIGIPFVYAASVPASSEETMAGVSLLGFALFGVRAVMQSWMVEAVPAGMGGTGPSLMFGTQSAMGALAPLIGGVVADAWGLATVFYMLAGTILIANVIVVMMPRDAGRQKA